MFARLFRRAFEFSTVEIMSSEETCGSGEKFTNEPGFTSRVTKHKDTRMSPRLFRRAFDFSTVEIISTLLHALSLL